MAKGLGRGLDSLLGILDDEKPVNNTKNDKKLDDIDKKEGVIDINMSLIDNNPAQPRKNFDPTALQELATSIKNYGVIQPIVVKKKGDRYLIIAGERRFRACKLAGVKTIPAVVRDYTDSQIKEIALLENIQREDLNPMETATCMQELLKDYGWTQEELSEKLGKSRPAVTNTLRLLSLCPEVQDMIRSGKLSAGHARCLVVVQDKDVQIRLANMAITKRITVRDMEKAIKELSNPQVKREVKPLSVELKDFVNSMQHTFSTKVNIKGDEKKGKIVINYYSSEDLDRIYNILGNIDK